jgi:chromosome segregation ATPase
MILRYIKYSLVGAAGLLLVGGFLFGSDVFSYIRSSARSVQTAVKDAVPMEFELKRARDLLDDIIPEMHANVRLIAQEEVEVNTLKDEIARHTLAIADEKVRVQKLRDALAVQQVSYTFAGREFSRDQLAEDLSRRFEQFKEAQVVLTGKQRLLTTREKSLQAAMTMLEKTKSQKARLEDKIASLESQWRLIRAASAGSRIQMDNSKLAQTEKLIADIKKRLDVSERILAHEAQFVEQIPVDAISEKDLLQQVDDYFAPKPPAVQQAQAEKPDGAVALNDVQPDHPAQ